MTKYLDSDLTSAGVNSSYSLNNFNGYITVPIGDSTFMTANKINNCSVNCAYKSYTGKQDDFTKPIFIETKSDSTVTLLYNAPSLNKIKALGHLVIPVYVPGYEANHYYTINSSNKIVLPTAGVPLDLQNQVVFVP